MQSLNPNPFTKRVLVTVAMKHVSVYDSKRTESFVANPDFGFSVSCVQAHLPTRFGHRGLAEVLPA